MTPEQLAALRARLAEQDMQGLADWQVSAALNTRGPGNGTAWQEVPTAAVHRRLMIDAPAAVSMAALSAWGLIAINARRAATTAFASAASAPSTQDQMISHMAALVAWVENFPTIDAADDAVRTRFAAIFAALVAGGWITTGTRDTVVAMASRQRSWAEANGFPDGVTPHDVGEAGLAP
jgi:hypothetical protein